MTDAIAGRMAKLKPWHYVVIGGVTAASIALIPTLSRLGEKKKTEDVTAATLAANNANGGEAWHAPSFPAPDVVTASFKPTAQPPAAPPVGLIATTPVAIPGMGGTPADYRMFGQRQLPPQPDQSAAAGGVQATRVAAAESGGPLGALLKPTETTGFTANRMAHPWATIEQGRVIGCNSMTPMTSGLPGFVKAKITYDVRSADGTTTLIDRNSTVDGEIAHGLAEGRERLFVLWRNILTPAPDLVRITINSPAADELGEAGLPGDIDHHTWKRIGGALMLSGIESVLQGGSQYLGNLSRGHGNGGNGGGGGGGLNFYSFQGQGSSLASSLLSHTVAIPDVLHRDQALPCSIFLSSDLDFSSVYQLRRKTHE